MTTPPWFALAALLTAACASAPRSRESTAASARIPDSAPEKVAAQRAASGLQLEQDDARWGIEAARERKANAEPKKNPPATATPAGAEPQPDATLPPPTVRATPSP